TRFDRTAAWDACHRLVSPSCIASALAMQLNPHQPKYPSSNLEPGLPLLIGTSTGGRSLLETFGTSDVIDKKEDHSNVVTAADSRSEEMIVRGIRRAYPGHSIIAEEAGCDLRESQFTWVVDPLDGT